MGLTTVLALTAAVLFGGADFLGGVASRKASPVIVSALVFGSGLVIVVPVALMSPGPVVTGHDIAWSVVSAAALAVGIVSLLTALSIGTISIVAPLAAGLAAAGPAVFDMMSGTRFSPFGLIGLALAVVAIVIVGTDHSPEEQREMPVAALWLSVLAGVGFAVSVSTLSLVGHAAGWTPLLIQRTFGMVTLGLAAAVMLVRPGPKRTPRPAGRPVAMAFVSGLFDASAAIALLSAVRNGPLAVAAVLGALYPVVTIMLAYPLLGERIHGRARAGVVLALVAVVLLAIPAG